MKFRFGWRKEQSIEKSAYNVLDGDKQVEPTEPVPIPESSIKMRIMVFGDKDEAGNLYTLFLRSKGYEVLHFHLPEPCALVTRNECTCPRKHVCADLFLIDIEMEGMSGLELIRRQNESGCRVLPWNKAILASAFTNRQEYEIRSLGCIPMCKPFRLKDLMSWVSECEKLIPPDRKLMSLKDMIDGEISDEERGIRSGRNR